MPSTAIVIRPEISISVPAAGSQLNLNVRLESASPSGFAHVQARPVEGGASTATRPAASLTAGICAIEKTAMMIT